MIGSADLRDVPDSRCARPAGGIWSAHLPQFAEENPAKYINSPESPLFSKSSMLYALDSARDEMGRSRNAVVMEGYTDTIVARQFGFDNTVAVLGTALGERHIRLLRRFADSITLVLDGDEAGHAGQMKFLACLWPSKSICESSRCPMISIRPTFCSLAAPRLFASSWNRPSTRWSTN